MRHAGILAGESVAAVAAGVNLLLWHETTVGLCQLQVTNKCSAQWEHATHLKGVQSVCQPATLAQQTSGFQIIFGRCCAGAVARGPLPVL